MALIDEALDGLSARELEQLQERLAKRLRVCAIDGNDGAIPVRITWKVRGGSTAASMLLCPACLERHRLPEERSRSAAHDREENG